MQSIDKYKTCSIFHVARSAIACFLESVESVKDAVLKKEVIHIIGTTMDDAVIQTPADRIDADTG